MYCILTELTVVVHLLFILFVIAGGFFARRRVWSTVVHLAAVAWAVYAEIRPGIVCPLTALENHFALRAGLATYEEDFITRYLVPVIYQDGLTLKTQYLLVTLVIGLNLLAYATKQKRNAA